MFFKALTFSTIFSLIISLTTVAEEYLSGSDVLLIGSGSLGSVYLGYTINKTDSIPKSLIKGPMPLERSLQKWLGGEYYAGKTNFLDDRTGSAITPIAGSILLLSANLKYPQQDKIKTAVQDQFLYFSGLVATKGVTSIAKGIFNRKRPYAVLYPNLAAQNTKHDARYDHQSFFSGHTSSAFFAMSFLNSRIRSIMRSEMNPDKYRKYRWVSPTITYGWATLVGWSRIHAYKHFISDVIVGAAAGYLMSELFLSFAGKRTKNTYEGSGNLIQFTFRF